MSLACAASLLLAFVWYGPVYGAFEEKSVWLQKSDALAVPSQQLAYTASQGLLEDEEIEQLTGLGYVWPTNYRHNLADASRETIRYMDDGDLARAYVRTGIEHPLAYTTAFLLHTSDLWNPYDYPDAYNGYAPYYDEMETSFFGCGTEPPSEFESKIPGLLAWLQDISRNLVLQKIPVLALLVSLPFYFWMLVICIGRAIMTKDRRWLPSMVFLGVFTLSAVFAPAVLPRFYVSLFFGLPLLAFALLDMRSAEEGLAKHARLASS